MPIANPLVQGSAQGPPPDASQGTSADALNGGAAAAAAPAKKMGPFSDPFNVPWHVAVLVLAALGVVAVLHVSGFRFAVDVGITR